MELVKEGLMIVCKEALLNGIPADLKKLKTDFSKFRGNKTNGKKY